MKKKPTTEQLEHEIQELRQQNKKLLEDIQRKLERIAWLEKQLFGSKRDRSKGASSQDGPTLFDQEFNEAYDARQQELKDAERQVADTSATRRAAARKRSASNRPEKYRYSGLEERVRVVMPEGVDLEP